MNSRLPFCRSGARVHALDAGVLSILTILFAALTIAGCDKGMTSQAPVTIELPKYKVDSPEWDGVGDDEVVATVGDARIPAWRVKKALAEAEPGADPNEVLSAVIAGELFARAAAGDDGFVPGRKTFEKALASRFIQKKLVEEFQPKDVPEEMLKEMFAIPQVWARFNHYDLYEVQDFQWICCADPANCDPEVSEYCFSRGEAPMKSVYEKLIQDRPDPRDLAILAPEFKKLADHLTYQEYTFAFDKTAGYQKGLTHVDTPVARAVMDLKAGEYTPPVRSRFGWHIARLTSHNPERHGDLTDPDVRLEIATVFIQRFRQDAFLRILASLAGTDSLMILQAYYKDRPKPDGKPIYDVKVFRDALRQAAGLQEAEKQSEPLSGY